MGNRVLNLAGRRVRRGCSRVMSFTSVNSCVGRPIGACSDKVFIELTFTIRTRVGTGVIVLSRTLTINSIFFGRGYCTHLSRLQTSKTTVLLISRSVSSVVRFYDSTVLLSQKRRGFVNPSSRTTGCCCLLRRGRTRTGVSSTRIDSRRRPRGARSGPSARRSGPSVGRQPPRSTFLSLSGGSRITSNDTHYLKVTLYSARKGPYQDFERNRGTIFCCRFGLAATVRIPVYKVVVGGSGKFVVRNGGD